MSHIAHLNNISVIYNSKVKIIDISETYQYTYSIKFYIVSFFCHFVKFGFSFTRKSRGSAENFNCFFFLGGGGSLTQTFTQNAFQCNIYNWYLKISRCQWCIVVKYKNPYWSNSKIGSSMFWSVHVFAVKISIYTCKTVANKSFIFCWNFNN